MNYFADANTSLKLIYITADYKMQEQWVAAKVTLDTNEDSHFKNIQAIKFIQ
jgi:hypothetical protein